MIKKILPAIALMIFFAFSASAQKVKKTQAYDEEKHSFHVHQHVMITMGDGSEKEAIIHGHISKKKYYVRQYKSRRQGEVHEKYIRALTEEEEEEVQARKNAKK